MSSSTRSSFLFAVPTWQEGVGRLVDFGNCLTDYNATDPPENADTRALAQDWGAVGDQLRWAILDFRP
jgi:hypothetical protein